MIAIVSLFANTNSIRSVLYLQSARDSRSIVLSPCNSALVNEAHKFVYREEDNNSCAHSSLLLPLPPFFISLLFLHLSLLSSLIISLLFSLPLSLPIPLSFLLSFLFSHFPFSLLSFLFPLPSYPFSPSSASSLPSIEIKIR